MYCINKVVTTKEPRILIEIAWHTAITLRLDPTIEYKPWAPDAALKLFVTRNFDITEVLAHFELLPLEDVQPVEDSMNDIFYENLLHLFT